MKLAQIPLLIALSGFITLNSFAQTWTDTSAPIADWTSIASSADGTKLIAISDRSRIYNYDGTMTPVGIYISTNSGATWMIPTNLSAPWTAAISADGSRMVATSVGGTPSVWISTNSGTFWAPVFSTSADLGTVASSADGHALLVGGAANFPPGFAFISTNFGSSWSQINFTLGGGGCYVASSADGVKMFAAGLGYGGSTMTSPFYVSTNAGVTWKKNLGVPTTNWSSVACSADGGKIVASVYHGLIYTSTNSGTSWITNNVPTTNWNCVASSADGTKLVAVFGNSTTGGGIYTSTNFGVTWILNSLTNELWYAAAQSADGNKWYAGGRVNSYAGEIRIASFQPQPVMNIMPTEGNLKLSWIIPSTDFVLQSSPDLSSWTDLTNQPVLNLTNLQDEVTLPLSAGNEFFRLKTP